MFKWKHTRRLLCGCIAMALLLIASFPCAYADSVSEKEAKIKSLLSSVRGTKDYSGYCGNCTADQLKSAGVFSTVYSPRNGKDFYNTYNGKKPSNGMSKTLFPGEGKNGSYTLTQICNLINEANTEGKMTYTVFCFKKGSSSDAGQQYGHVLLVHSIYNGKVYWGESFGSKTRISSIADFCNTYKKKTVSGKTCYLFDGAIAYDYSPAPSASTLEFRNVTYPNPYKIGTSGGYKLSGGTVVSDVELKTISTKIVDGNGKEISKEKTYNISGKSYAISKLDTFSGDDNGVRFSYIKNTGKYYWVLKATDSNSRTLTMWLAFDAVSSGSTGNANKSLQYPNSDTDPINHNIFVTAIELHVINPIELNHQVAFTPYFIPENATNKDFKVSSSNEAVLKVEKTASGGISYSGVGVGTADLICTALDGSGTTERVQVTVTAPPISDPGSLIVTASDIQADGTFTVNLSVKTKLVANIGPPNPKKVRQTSLKEAETRKELLPSQSQ